MTEFREALDDTWTQVFRVDEVLLDTRTDFQHIQIFSNRQFGRVMALDGVVQTTEADEFVYHEMLAHVPLFAHGAVRRVLVLGGGDGGTVREVLRHTAVEHVRMVEIDAGVVDAARTHMPALANGAFDDPRLQLDIGDGLAFIERTDESYDVILSDSTDPIGPGEALHSSSFYENCRLHLNPGGVFVAQSGNSFDQLNGVTQTASRLNQLFEDVSFYLGDVPTYIGGAMTFAWGSDSAVPRSTSLEVLAERLGSSAMPCRYYTPEVHLAAFVLPGYVQHAISGV